MGSDFTDSLSLEKLRMFVANLSGPAPEEMRKAKILYIKDSSSEYNARRERAIEHRRQADGRLSPALRRRYLGKRVKTSGLGQS